MRLIYRPEIDGLRAIAVGSVILYHAQISIFGHQPFKGGFIGVDIFFVISGYLITSIILKELFTTGFFSFKHFYERRVRRILPALLFVMLISLPLAWIYFLPSSIIEFSKSIIYSLGFSSNLFFYYSGLQYGNESALLKPFLHTWSLAVEEQYYILFPIILLITFRYFKKYLIHILILGFVLSLGLAEWSSRNYPSISFYFLHTRMWELLAGSILAYLEIILGHRSKSKTLNLILPSIGLLLIFHFILFFNDKMLHPSFYTLSPIIGVCLIIWFSNKDEIITKILSTKLFVGVGLISYSLYLWHYPIFAFSRTPYFLDGFEFKRLLVGISIFILSIVSYYFVELPFRNKILNFKKLLIILISFIVFITSINFYIIYSDGIKTRFPKIFHVNLKENNINYFQKDNLQKVVLVGDSHSDALGYNLNEEIKKNNLSLFRFWTYMYLKDFIRIDRKTKKNYKDLSRASHYPNLIQDNNEIDSFLENNSNLIVIFHQMWNLKMLETRFDNGEVNSGWPNIDSTYLEPIGIRTYSQEQRFEYIKEGLISKINYIINQGHKLILVYPVPEAGANVPGLLYSKYLNQKIVSSNFSIPIISFRSELYKKRNRLIFEVLDSIQSSSIYRVYPHKLFCNKQIKKRCVQNDENNLFYYDNNHLSLKGSELVVDKIMKVIKQSVLESN